jgi:hypothetical protein
MKFVALLMLPALLFVGCSKSGSSVDSSGNCTQTYIDAYNSVVTANNSAIRTSSDSDITQLNTSCMYLQRNHSGVSCNALMGQISTSDHANRCSIAARYMTAKESSAKQAREEAARQQTEPQQPVVEKASQADDESPITNLNLKSVDGTSVTAITNSTTTHPSNLIVALNGKVSPMTSAVTAFQSGQTVCWMIARTTTPLPAGGMNSIKSEETASNDGGGRVLMVTMSNDLALACMRKNPTPFKLKDLRQTLDGIIEVSAAN